ncbi:MULTISPECIES: hypothetical protein [Roseobacteraceae]|uniref:hypothetical protein n=1 Tax=Roseobacteraceae TaxID=2854170 RepID=UPI000C2CFA18|nr:hypothetical protein [Sagittula sp. P11]AUC55545.1 hypothetical protein CDO87_21340 [Sagittula sp. P11]
MSICKAEKLGALALIVAALPAFAQEHGGESGGESGEDTGTMLTVTDAPVQEDIRLACRFERECYEDEACSDGGFAPLLDARAGGMDPSVMMVEANLIADAGTVFMVGAKDGGRLSLSGGDFDARHLLTISEAGDVRYTVHYAEGPMMVSYLGRCEAEE